ncbi:MULTISPECIES: hypothetical protein [Acinetobacter calcoaceticus/baumannii complex]|uniref:hypothetical protein n=1 Tax=Acinetobacter calcoaceticus/baumannii complex TaxID=909768 RepID=UPI00070B660A|nr:MULTISPECIES: hypothetical protein [Acinetobacter calcoaceticus/baumannii complex]KRJ33581.1 hypothetical protein APC83_11125 [Acinetobacter baumannii]MCQ1098285.1 hypothetical protein [Acinetobacter baumannii]MDA3523947.1 hypothetical protein [Acinetobacter baumannii]MDA3529457.1 hypothetical protein [Acinetobacter baumannii]MDI9659962.1 hypothetical protein [Acinetobacter nosocomialis]
MTNNVPAYIVVECRPSTEEDGYADIVIHNDTYIFESVEPAENLRAAMLIAIDIERTRPEHKHITLHAESILKLCRGIQGKPLNA